METKLTKNGVSTTTAAGQEQWEKFRAPNRKMYIQYDYRHTNGVLFSTIAPTLEQCRQKRDKWIKENK